MRIFRWVITIPSAIVGFYIGLTVGYLIHSAGEKACPAEKIISGHCVAPWMRVVTEVAVALGSAIAAFLVVLLPFLVAPAYKLHVAMVAFIGGLSVAIYFIIAGDVSSMLLPFVFAFFAGIVALWFTRKLHKRRGHRSNVGT